MASERWEDIRVSLGADAEVTGKLSFTTPTRIEGKLKGEIRATCMIVIGTQATVHATVRAESIVVLGEVYGEVHAAQRLEIGKTGRVYGDVHAPSLVITEGGMFEGRCRMEAGKDTTRTKEPA